MKILPLLVGILLVALICSPVLAMSKSELIASYELAQDDDVFQSFFPSQYGTVSELIKGSMMPTPTPTPDIGSWISPTPIPITPTPEPPRENPTEQFSSSIEGSLKEDRIPTSTPTSFFAYKNHTAEDIALDVFSLTFFNKPDRPLKCCGNITIRGQIQ